MSESYAYTAGGLVTAKGYQVQVPGYTDSGGGLQIQYSGYAFGFSETYSWDSEGNQTGYGPFAYTLDQMGRATGLTETGPGMVSVRNATYGPGGEAQGLQYRASNGAYYTESRSYNNLNQLKQLVTSGSGLAGMNLSYGYNAGTNNGQIASMTDGNSGEQITYTYDSLKRLHTAQTTQSQTQYPSAPWWGQMFGYDGFGNLLSKTVTAGQATAMSVGVDPTTNHLLGNGFSYDSNGNMTGVPGNPNQTLTYDMDNRTGGTVYDLQNQPLDRAGVWNLYGLNGERLGTYTTSVTYQQYSTANGAYYVAQVAMTQTSRNIYFGGRLIQSNGSSVATDRVGSVRATEGGVVSEYYPYGEEISHTADGREKFGTYTRESSGAAAGLDYANQRYYSSVYGRFTSADRYETSVGPSDPVTWNRYAYVGGDPVNRYDPFGLDWWDANTNTLHGDPPTQNNPASLAYGKENGAFAADESIGEHEGGGGAMGCGIGGGFGFVLYNAMVPCIQSVASVISVSANKGPVDCENALRELVSATAVVVGRVNDIVAFGGRADPGHAKALRQAVARLSGALAKVVKGCATLAAAGAAIGAAEAAIEAAGPYLVIAAAVAAVPANTASYQPAVEPLAVADWQSGPSTPGGVRISLPTPIKPHSGVTQ